MIVLERKPPEKRVWVVLVKGFAPITIEAERAVQVSKWRWKFYVGRRRVGAFNEVVFAVEQQANVHAPHPNHPPTPKGEQPHPGNDPLKGMPGYPPKGQN